MAFWNRKPKIEEMEERSFPTLSVDDWNDMFGFPNLQYGGFTYPLGLNQTLQGKIERIHGNFDGFSRSAYKGNSVVYACMHARRNVFSQARLQFRKLTDGRPGDLFDRPNLDLFRNPRPGETTGDLLAWMIQDADLAGNAFVVNWKGELRRLRPSWVDILMGSQLDPGQPGIMFDSDVVGYLYYPNGNRGEDPIQIRPELVAHYKPHPDPTAINRGMSWLTPLIREIEGDVAMTQHKGMFMEQGATPNMVVKFDNAQMKPEIFDQWVKKFEEGHKGVANAYKTLYLAGGADATAIGSNFQQIEFAETQAAGESRICSVAGVPPIIIGAILGLRAATYSNYELANRAFVDSTIRPLWRNACGSLEKLVKVPPNSELWYDDRDIEALQQSQDSKADVVAKQMAAINTGVIAGFPGDDVVRAVAALDISLLEGTHGGLIPVQLHDPTAKPEPPVAPPNLMPPAGATPPGEPKPPSNGAKANTPAK